MMTRHAVSRKDLLELLNRSAIALLLDRYAQALDDRCFEKPLKTLFSNDCLVELPPGAHRGLDNLDLFHCAVMAPFRQTQHIFTNYVINIARKKATFRANMHAIHVCSDADSGEENGLFIAGGLLTGTSILSCDGWRISRIALQPIWRHGKGPGPDMQLSLWSKEDHRSA
jgi:hypothetical protein